MSFSLIASEDKDEVATPFGRHYFKSVGLGEYGHDEFELSTLNQIIWSRS